MMKPYDRHHLLPLLLAALLLAGCRTVSRRSALHQAERRDSTLAALALRTHASLDGQLQSHARTSADGWRITLHFDPSLPTDPQTRLPPLRRATLEGTRSTQELEHRTTLHAEAVDSMQAAVEQASATSQQSQEERSRDTGRGGGGTWLLLIPAAVILLLVLGLGIRIYRHFKS